VTIAGDTMIAQVAAGNVTLSPRSTSDLSLVGRLIPQNSSDGLAAVSDIFNNFVAGKPSDVIVQGDSVGPGTVSHYRHYDLLSYLRDLRRSHGSTKESSH